MKDEILSIIVISIAMGILEIIIPSNNSLQRYVKILGGLCIIVIISMGAIKTINKIDIDFLDELKNQLTDNNASEKENYEDILHNYLTDFSEVELKKQIKEILYEKFGVLKDESSIKIFTSLNKGNLKLEKIQILLSGKSIFNNPYTIEDYFIKLMSCKCEVLINENER